jgi:hypothetical protein
LSVDGEHTLTGSPLAPYPVVPDDDLERLIRDNQRYMRFYFIFAISVVSAGILIFVLVFTVFSSSLSDTIKSLLGIASGFISSLSSLQIKELLSRREQQEYFQSVRTGRSLRSQAGQSPDESWKRKEEILWKILEKKASG